MKLISLNKIADNMVLAKNVYAREGNVLLAKEAPLKKNYATKLLEWGVNSVYVRDDQGDQLEIDEELCQQAQNSIFSYFHEFLADVNHNQLPESMQQRLETILKALIADRNILWNLVEMRAVSEDIFRHCVNVCIISMIIGSFRGYPDNRLTELATGAMLIDLGKITVAHEFLDDPKISLTQENIEIQEHTRLGFEKLKQLKGNYENAAQVVLQHHEKYDGTGFPQGLKGDQIHEFARIASIADIFHLQQHNIQDISPSQIISNYSGTFCDPELAQLFSREVAPFVDNGISGKEDSFPAEHGRETSPETAGQMSRPEIDEAEIQKPSDTEYRHDSGIKQENGSLFSKMFGRFGSKDILTDDITDLKQTKPDLFIDKEQQGKSRLNPLLDERNQNPGTVVSGQAGVSPIPKNNIDENDKFVVYPEWCEHTKEAVLKIITRALTKISTDLVSKTVIETTQKTIEQVIENNNVIRNLVKIQALDENVFVHCVTVGLLSVMTGVSLGYNQEQLIELATGSLLVDVGKVEISRRYNVDARWFGTTEYEAIMPEHTQFGFEELWKMNPNTSIPYIALQHHERYDGSGYPVGLKGEQISELARIVALADVYDSLIYEGMNGQKLLPHEVIEYIRDFSGSHFDPEICRVFLQNTIPLLVGSNVLLNTGEKATVIRINKDLLARPLIRVIVDKDGNKLATPIAKDLATDLTLFIVGTLKDDEF